MKTLRKSFDSLFRTELDFPVGLKFKNLYRDQNCSARQESLGAEASRSLFDGERRDGAR